MSDVSSKQEAARAIEEASKISLVCHVGPDGDALGSMLALAEAAASHGKEVQASFGSPFVVQDNLSFLPVSHLVPPGDFDESPELMVLLDAGSPDRIGELAANAKAADKVLVLDHHVTNEGFGDIAVVDPGAAATGEIVYDILLLLDWPITPQIATSLHTALVTDTGRFQYSNTTPRTLEIASELIAAGAEPARIGQHVYEEVPFGYLQTAAAVLGRAHLDVDMSVVSSHVTEDDLSASGIGWADIDGLIDTLRLAREADTAVLLKQHSDGRVKASMRSRGRTDVGSLAAELGGGGHRLAAGFTIEAELGDVLAQVMSRLTSHR